MIDLWEFFSMIWWFFFQFGFNVEHSWVRRIEFDWKFVFLSIRLAFLGWCTGLRSYGWIRFIGRYYVLRVNWTSIKFEIFRVFFFFSYDELGNTRGSPRFNALKPIKLKWNISENVSRILKLKRSTKWFVRISYFQCNMAIEKSLAQATKLYNDVDLHVYVQDAYGKGFMKKCKLSPDAYIQMALQLAHYRVKSNDWRQKKEKKRLFFSSFNRIRDILIWLMKPRWRDYFVTVEQKLCVRVRLNQANGSNQWKIRRSA